MPCGNRDRDWSDVIYKSKKGQRLPANTEARKRQGKSLLRISKGYGPADALISEF